MASVKIYLTLISDYWNVAELKIEWNDYTFSVSRSYKIMFNKAIV